MAHLEVQGSGDPIVDELGELGSFKGLMVRLESQV